MQINIGEEQSSEESFFFEPLPLKLLEDKEGKEMLAKWGLADTLKIGSFRYNQQLQDYEINRFLVDLFNNPNVRYIMSNVRLQQSSVGSVESDKLRCQQLTMQLFDQLEKSEIVRKGYISKMMSDYYEDIEIGDRLRECILLEESENYCIFSEAQRKELLLRLFQVLVVGGSFNQYEDLLQPYLDWTKKIYKSLVSVRKRGQTGEIFMESQFYEIKSMDGGKSFKKGRNPQDVLYVLINPSLRCVHVIANEWRKFW